MDYFLHLKREEVESDVESNTSENSEEIRNDIESRLYSIIHHNDLSQPLPPELEALYSIKHTDEGEIIVSSNKNSSDNCIQKMSENCIVSSYIENEKHIKTTAILNNENRMNKEKTVNSESQITTVKDNPKFDEIDTCGEQNETLPKPYYSKAKRGRYSDALIEEAKDLPVTVNGYTNEEDSYSLTCLKNWKNNSKLDFIPIGRIEDTGLKLHSKNDLDTTFSKIIQLYPDICDIKLKNFLNTITKSKKCGKQITVKTIIKNNKRFFKNRSNFKNENLYQKKQEQINEINPVHIQSTECDDEDCKILEIGSNSELSNKTYGTKELEIKEMEFNTIIKPTIEGWLKKHPSWSLGRIKKKLWSIGYRYSKRTLLSSTSMVAHFPNLCAVNSVKLPLEDSLITNVIQLNSNVGDETPVPVITIDTSDEELDNAIKNKVNLNLSKDCIDLTHNCKEFGKESSRKDCKSKRTNLTQESREINIDEKTIMKHQSCPPKKWTKKMIKFYDKESKRLHKFDHEDIIFRLRQDYSRRDWLCSNDDYSKQYQKQKFERNMRCTNCFSFGHGAFSCKRPKRITTCHMCGMEGHKVFSCPEKKCLNCGDFSNSYCSMCSKCRDYAYAGHPCEICSSESHPKELCADLWRCYHSTTSSGPIVNTSQTPNTRKICSYCSKKGHFAHECKLDGLRKIARSSFVKNHNPLEQLIDYRDIMLSPELYSKLQTPKGEEFLQFLSNQSNTRIDLLSTNSVASQYGTDKSLRCFGTPEQWEDVRSQLMKWANKKTQSVKKNKIKKNLK